MYRADGGEDDEEIARPTYAPLPDQEVSINNLFNTNVNEIIGKPEVIDSIKTHCNPDNMTIVAEKAMIDDYEKKYGPLALSDPSCGRRTQGSFLSIFQGDTLNSNFPFGLIKIQRLQEIKQVKNKG